MRGAFLHRPLTKATIMTNREDSRKNMVLLVLCAAMFLDSLDTSLVSVALPRIQHDLGLSNASLQWLVSGYTVAYGGFLLLGGRLADLFGRRRVFLGSMVLFALASLAGGLVSTGGLLIATRLVKGLAAAMTAPAAMSIITTTFREGHERNRALGFYTATAASGYSLGLVLSGLLTQLSWRLVFLAPIPVAVLVIAVTPFAVHEPPAEPRRRTSFDFGGAITSTGAVLLFVYSLVNAPQVGWGAASTLGCLGGAAVLAVAFVLIERAHRNPTVPLRLLHSRVRGSANVLALVFAAASLGWQFTATLYLQRFLGYGPLKTALALLPIGVTILLVAQFVTGRLLARFPMRAVAGVGILIQGAGISLYTLVGVTGNYPAILLPGLLLHGIGNGLVFPTMNIAGVSGVADREQGVASGMITATFQIGVGMGVAVLTGVMTATTHGTSVHAQLHGYHAAFAAAALFSLAGAVVSLLGLGTPKTDAVRTAPPVDAVAEAPVGG
jgi:EmrB/QacA subfamily drug resistance transporter